MDKLVKFAIIGGSAEGIRRLTLNAAASKEGLKTTLDLRGALHLAIRQGEYEVIRELIIGGADVSERNDRGETLSDIAKSTNDDRLAGLIDELVSTTKEKLEVIAPDEQFEEWVFDDVTIPVETKNAQTIDEIQNLQSARLNLNVFVNDGDWAGDDEFSILDTQRSPLSDDCRVLQLNLLRCGNELGIYPNHYLRLLEEEYRPNEGFMDHGQDYSSFENKCMDSVDHAPDYEIWTDYWDLIVENEFSYKNTADTEFDVIDFQLARDFREKTITDIFQREINHWPLLTREEEASFGVLITSHAEGCLKNLVSWEPGRNEFLGLISNSRLADEASETNLDEDSEVESKPAGSTHSNAVVDYESGRFSIALAGLDSFCEEFDVTRRSVIEALVVMGETSKLNLDLMQNLNSLILARDRLISCNLRLTVSIAKKFRWSALPLPDLIQIGNIGLMKAVDGWDSRLGFKFSTYAMSWIRQAIFREIYDFEFLIRFPVHVRERLATVRLEYEALDPEGLNGDGPGRTQSIERMSRDLNLDINIFRLGFFQQNKEPIDIDSCEEELSSPMIPLNVSIDPIGLKSALSYLSKLEDRERLVIVGRLIEDKTLEEIGKDMGVTRERIRQLEKKALRKIALWAK